MNKKKDTIFYISMILINIFVFFGYIIPTRSAFLVFTTIYTFGCYLMFYKKINKKVIKKNLLWLLLLLYLFISLIYTYNIDFTIKFIITYACTLLIKIVYDSIDVYSKFDWKKQFIKISYFCSGIHVIATYIMNFFPKTMININSHLLNPSAYANNLLQHTQGLNAGMCDDYGFNAFCVLMFVGITLSKVFNNGKLSKKDIIFLIIGIVAQILIGKRGHLLCLVIGAIICFLLAFSNIKLSRKIAIILGSCIIIFSIYYVANKIPETQILFKRLEQSKTVDGMLNGRESIYRNSIEVIKTNTMFGIGIRGIYSKFGGDGHNIYLQLLAELGIVGAIIVFINFIYYFIKATILYLNNTENKKKLIIMISIFIQIYFLVNGITENPFYVESILVYYMVITSLLNFNMEKK